MGDAALALSYQAISIWWTLTLFMSTWLKPRRHLSEAPEAIIIIERLIQTIRELPRISQQHIKHNDNKGDVAGHLYV